MSQPSSSIISADNAEIKYKKALKEISKLISANRALRESNDKTTRELKEKLDQLSLRYDDLEKQYESVRKQKENFNHYLDQIQKQRKNLQRQVVYLNEVLAEQNAELKKLNAHKDERAVAALIRTYQQKQSSMNRSRSQNQDMIAKLKSTVERLENQLQYEKVSKQQTEDHFRRLSSEMRNYQEQNNSLLNQVERLLKESSQKDAYCADKQKELRSLANQFQKQIGLLKSAQQETLRSSKTNQNQAYEQLLNQKNRLSIQFNRMQNAYEDMILRQKEYFQMEQKMKTARLQAERANEEVNMLKSKIVLLEAKDFLQEAGDDDYNQKFFEQRLNLLIAQNDPLISIKNHDDSSHFRILKSFIVDLQDKIYKINNEKKEINRKYKSMKTKFIKNAQELTHFEEQNKLMKGKLQGYERLTEKLQFQLQRALTGNEEEITRMTITSNNLITKKVEEYKSAVNLLNSQLEMNQDKAIRTEKNYKQEIETLRLELDTLKIRYKDETDKTNKDNQLIDLYKKKNSDLSSRVSTLQEQISITTENLNKFEQLFKEEKGKNEGLIAQKQQLLAQTRQLSEEVDKKSSTFNSTFKIKEDQYEFQLRKLKSENQKMKDELEYSVKEAKSLKKDLEEARRGDQNEFAQIKRLTQRNSELEGKIIELKGAIRGLEDEIETGKIKNKKFQESYEKTAKYEQENTSKNDKINDLTREKILLESQIKNLQNHLNEEVKQNEQFKKELSNLKMKNLEGNHESKREFQAKMLESKKVIQSLNQDLSDLTTELRDQKSKNLRLTSQLNTVKAEKGRLQDLVDQNRKKDLQNEGQVSNIKLQLSNAELQIERLQSQVKSHQSISNNLNIEIETLQQKIFTQNQELSNFKMKLESAEDMKNDLIKDLNSFKYYFSTVETHVNQAKTNLNLPWQDQNFYSGVSDILSKIKRIWRNYGITIENAVTTFTTSAQITPSINPVQPKPATSYHQFFSSYAEQDGSGYKPSTRSDRNFDASIGTTQSIGLNKLDYNYSTSSYGGTQSIVNSLSAQNDWNRPTYEYNPSRNNNFQFNISGLSKVSEE